MDFHLEGLNSLRTSVAAILGIGTTVNFGLAALVFRDKRSPEPGWTPAVAFLLLALTIVLGAILLISMRHAAQWPAGDQILEHQRGSAIDLRERYLSEFRTKVAAVRKSARRYEGAFIGVIVLLASSAAVWIIALANTPPPAGGP